MRDSLKMPIYQRPWTGKPNAKLRGVPAVARAHDVIDVCSAAYRKRFPPTEPIESGDTWVNIARGVEYLPYFRGPLPVCVPAAVWYHYGKDTVLSGAIHLKAMGWPDGSAPIGEFSDSDCKRTASGSLACPLAALLSAAFYMNPAGPWWSGV